MPTLDELESLKTQLQSMNTEESEILLVLVKAEIKRRSRAGRPPSKMTLRERNRLAQQRFRAKQKELQSKR